MVTVKVFAMLRETVGDKEFEVHADNVKELLNKAGKRYGKKFKKQARVTKIFVNGVDINHLGGLKTTLKDGDTVALLPPASGG